jgi:uncharacterized spore protein YtfJ
MKIQKFFIFIFLTTLITFTGSLSAKGECKEDKKKFCKDVKKGEGRVFQCLVDHYNDLSSECKDSIDKKRKNWQQFKDQCGTDLDKFCPNVLPGKGRIRACLAKNKDQLSESCKNFLKEHKKNKKDKKDQKKAQKEEDVNLESISEIENEVSKEE